MATMLAHIQVKPGREAAFEAVIRPLFTRSHADEAALLRYEYWRGETVGRYYALLAFSDYAGFMAHQDSDHHEAATPLLGDLVAEMWLEWLSPVEGASPLPAFTSAALPSNPSAVMRRYAAMFPMASPDWWRDAASSVQAAPESGPRA